jgi:hypothetical protein
MYPDLILSYGPPALKLSRPAAPARTEAQRLLRGVRHTCRFARGLVYEASHPSQGGTLR